MEWVLIVWVFFFGGDKGGALMSVQFATEEACELVRIKQEAKADLLTKVKAECYRTGVPSQAQFMDELGKALKGYERKGE